MSRLSEVYSKQDRGQLKAIQTDESIGLKTHRKASYFELPRLLMDLSPDLLEELKCITHNIAILGTNELKTLMFCSVDDDGDSSTVALNLAGYLARTERRAILFIEANVYSPTLYRFNKGEKCDGFCEFLDELRPVESYAMPSTEPRLFVIHAGGSSRLDKRPFPRVPLKHAVRESQSNFSLVIFDAPPVETEACLALAGTVDGTILVIKEGELTERVQRARSLLDKSQARLLGAIMMR